MHAVEREAEPNFPLFGYIFTKQLFPKHFERLRMVLLGHENWDDMVQRVESVTTAGDDIDDPKLYASGDSALRGKGGHHK